MSRKISTLFGSGSTKTMTYWGLEVNGEKQNFRTKKLAISVGKALYKIDPKVKLYEEYTMFHCESSNTHIIDRQTFDRTMLIMTPEDIKEKITKQNID